MSTCPSQCCFRKCQKNPTPRKSPATELQFRAENYFQLGCFPGLTCRKTTLRLHSPTLGAWPRVLLRHRGRYYLRRTFWSLPKYLLSVLFSLLGGFFLWCSLLTPTCVRPRPTLPPPRYTRHRWSKNSEWQRMTCWLPLKIHTHTQTHTG